MEQTQAERARAEASLRASEAKYRTLFESMGQGYAEIEAIRDHRGRAADFRLVELNPAWERLTGLPAADARGRTVREVVPDIEEWWIEMYARVARERQPERIEYELAPLGRWYEAHVHPHGSERLAVFYEDITERKLAEQALRAGEERYAFLLKLSDALRPLADPVSVQDTACRTLGEQLGVDRVQYSEIDLARGKIINARDFFRGDLPSHVGEYDLAVYPHHAEAWIAGRSLAISDVAADSTLEEGERTGLLTHSVAATLTVPLLKNGSVVAVMAALAATPRQWSNLDREFVEQTVDRTWSAVERARAEASLRASEERYRTLFESMGQGYAECDLIRDSAGRVTDLRYVELNPAFERLTGIRAADARGRTLREVVPDIEDWWTETYDRIVRTGRPERIEHWVAPLGRWYEVHAHPHGSERLTVFYEDITERKLADQALREGEERQAFLLRLSDALRVESGEDAIAAAAVELTAAQMRVDRCWIALLIPGEGRAVVAHDHRRPDLRSIKGEYRYSDFPEAAKQIEAGMLALDDVQSDASFADEEKAGFASLGIGAQLSACPRKAEGRVIWSLSVADDAPRSWTRHEVTLLEEAAERTWAALEQARVEALMILERERHGELEREFIANAAHELRTPLAAIVALVEALNDGGKDVPEDRERFLGHLSREAARLARLSDSLLLLARMDDQGELPRSDVRVRELLADVAEELKERAAVPVRVDAASNLSLVTNGGLLERAVVNLAENAARHTEDGEIQLWARRVDGRVVLEVRDTGGGVSAEVAERAFDRFYRGGARTADGFGLGLAIAHQVAQALGGMLELEPRDGGGTTARLSLPRATK